MRAEIETLAEFDAVVASGTLRRHVVQSVDLTDRDEVLAQVDVHSALFLGCRLDLAVAQDLTKRGASVFPRLPRVPFDAYRSLLYSPDDLYDGLDRGYAHTLDGRVYAWTLKETSKYLDGTLAQSLHDHAMTDALGDELAVNGNGVGVMGGHALLRGSEQYRAAAQLGHALADLGRLVITGGGPGAMEAANLGASWPGSASEVDEVCTELARVPSFRDDVDAWARLALEVRASKPRLTVGIPTWFYGHEPPNPFATAIAKYFDNAIREDMLMQVCGAGIVFMPGAAGTTQEIFQAVTRNYYALETHELRPLVLVGREFWTEKLPAWPLLQALASGRLMEPHIHLVDSLDEVAEIVG